MVYLCPWGSLGKQSQFSLTKRTTVFCQSSVLAKDSFCGGDCGVVCLCGNMGCLAMIDVVVPADLFDGLLVSMGQLRKAVSILSDKENHRFLSI